MGQCVILWYLCPKSVLLSPRAMLLVGYGSLQTRVPAAAYHNGLEWDEQE